MSVYGCEGSVTFVMQWAWYQLGIPGKSVLPLLCSVTFPQTSLLLRAHLFLVIYVACSSLAKSAC